VKIYCIYIKAHIFWNWSCKCIESVSTKRFNWKEQFLCNYFYACILKVKKYIHKIAHLKPILCNI